MRCSHRCAAPASSASSGAAQGAHRVRLHTRLRWAHGALALGTGRTLCDVALIDSGSDKLIELQMPWRWSVFCTGSKTSAINGEFRLSVNCPPDCLQAHTRIMRVFHTVSTSRAATPLNAPASLLLAAEQRGQELSPRNRAVDPDAYRLFWSDSVSPWGHGRTHPRSCACLASGDWSSLSDKPIATSATFWSIVQGAARVVSSRKIPRLRIG